MFRLPPRLDPRPGSMNKETIRTSTNLSSEYATVVVKMGSDFRPYDTSDGRADKKLYFYEESESIEIFALFVL